MARKHKLPTLLEERRQKYGIPDGAFNRVATFDRVLLWQIPTYDDSDTFKGTRIIMSERSKERALSQAPRGVVITAGLEALDWLWAHGGEIGSIVEFVRLSPWCTPIDIVEGSEKTAHVVRCGDIIAVEDIAPGLYSGEIEVVRDEHGLHQYKINGKVRFRRDPEKSDDY